MTDTAHEHAGRAARQTAALLTTDNVRIDAEYLPAARHTAAETAAGAGPALVLAHGFSGSRTRPAVRRVAAALSRRIAVVTVSLRGHGASSGHSTLGDREIRDVRAAVAWARALGHREVCTLGFSLGAAVVLRHAALFDEVRAVAAVSAPGRWYYRGTAPMRRLHWAITRPEGRLVSRALLRTRVGQEWARPPMPPLEAAARIAPVPLLLVHGDADPYFPVSHARGLYQAAGEPRQLWIEPGYGHAENAASDDLVDRLGGWLAQRCAA